MKFDHTVKHNGILYPAGTDVPVEDEKTEVEQVKVPPETEAPTVEVADTKPDVKKAGK